MTEAAEDTYTGSITRPKYLWQLNADPNAIDRAAQSWRALARAVRDQASGIDDRAQKLHDGQWRGETAETYDAHRRKLTRDLGDIASAADGAAEALEWQANKLRFAQDGLDGSLAEAKDACDGDITELSTTFTFYPVGDAASSTVERQIALAEESRRVLDDELLTYNTALTRAHVDLGLVMAAWDARSVAPFTMPPEAKSVGVIHDLANHRFIINTGDRDDNVDVIVGPNRERAVVVNGVTYPVPDGMEITVRTAGGRDIIAGPYTHRVNVTVLAGDGDDTVRLAEGNDRVLAGPGHDLVYPGDGDDRASGNSGPDLISDSHGNDVLSGGDGNDTQFGNFGDDRISGGDGADSLWGDEGQDQVSGGAHDDALGGGDGNDIVRGEAGDEKIRRGGGKDTNIGGT